MNDLFAGILPFVEAARARSLRRAADKLGVSPAAVSKAIRRLEDDLGVQLLNRTTRRVNLSPEGALFLARCEEAIAQLRAGRQQLEMSRHDPAGELTVSASFILGPLLVARLPRFLGRYPKLELHLRLSDQYSELIDEGVDVALRVGELEDSALVSRRLLESRWVTVAAPAYLARAGTPAQPEALLAHNCLRFRSPRGQLVDWRFAGGRGLAVAGNLTLDQGELLLQAAAQGAGVFQALDFMVGEYLRDGRLVEVLAEYACPGPPVQAVYLQGQRASPRVRALVDFLAEVLG